MTRTKEKKPSPNTVCRICTRADAAKRIARMSDCVEVFSRHLRGAIGVYEGRLDCAFRLKPWRELGIPKSMAPIEDAVGVRLTAEDPYLVILIELAGFLAPSARVVAGALSLVAARHGRAVAANGEWS